MKKILVIQYSDSVRANIVDLLNMENFVPIEAENGFVGVELAQKVAPDLIICDLLLPQLDGYGVLSALRQTVATATIPFVFLTCMLTQEDWQKGIFLGANDYLLKPFNIQKLLNTINALL